MRPPASAHHGPRTGEGGSDGVGGPGVAPGPAAPRLDRLTLFVHVWSLATLCDAVRWIAVDSWWGWPMGVTAALAAWRPRWWTPFVAMMSIQVAFVFVGEKPGWTPNHSFFIALVNVAILGWAIRSRWRRGRVLGAPGARLIDVLAPAAGWALLVFYGFVVLHKLNDDFFDPDVSCAAVMYAKLASRYGFLPAATPVVGAASIGLTILCEAAIPLLLVFRRTRLVGIALGVLFHFVLAQYPMSQLCSFASMLYAIYVLLLPPGFTDRVGIAWSALLTRIVRRWPQRTWNTRLAVLLVALVAVAVAVHRSEPLRLLDLSNALWNLWALVVFGLVAVAAKNWRQTRAEPSLAPFPRTRLGVSLVLMVFFVGSNPYLGLRTETSWAMFSNLHTEGDRTNHWFLPTSIQLTDLQRDLVSIRSSTDRRLQSLHDRELDLPYHELRRRLARLSGDFAIEYVRDGKIESVSRTDGVSSRPELTRFPPFAWWLHFRPVSRGAERCSH